MSGAPETPVGIDDIAIHFPRLYMDMKDFADLRGADYGKLSKSICSHLGRVRSKGFLALACQLTQYKAHLLEWNTFAIALQTGWW